MQHISSPKRTSEILSRYGIRLKKNLGQNYMIDTNSIRKMVSSAGVKLGDTVLEIGSGIGSLTEILAEEGARVVAVEIDKKVSDAFSDIFAEELATGRVVLITEDAMDIDYGKLYSEYDIDKMVSNLPYKVSAPLMLKILRESDIKKHWITVQKDIADRILAGIGDKNYSSYSVKANFLADWSMSFKVSRNCFIPRPFVDSVVLEVSRKLLPSGFEDDRDVEDLFNLINASFAHRRKKLLNSLSLDARYSKVLPVIGRLLSDRGKDAGVRAEELALEDFIYIYKNMG